MIFFDDFIDFVVQMTVNLELKSSNMSQQVVISKICSGAYYSRSGTEVVKEVDSMKN